MDERPARKEGGLSLVCRGEFGDSPREGGVGRMRRLPRRRRNIGRLTSVHQPEEAWSFDREADVDDAERDERGFRVLHQRGAAGQRADAYVRLNDRTKETKMTEKGKIQPGGFYSEPALDFGARIALGLTTGGVSDVGIVYATLDKIAEGDLQGWFDAWSATANRLSSKAEAAKAVGHHRSAQWYFLAASESFHQALNVVDGLPDQTLLLPTYRSHRRCWDAMIAESEGRFVPIAVPYEGTTLPGFMLRPDATGKRRPTLIVTNGSDDSLSGMYGWTVQETLARGWNVFVYDGPGQQSMLRERGVPFRHDWEAVLTPVVDALVTRSDVDPAKLTGYGASQAGYWLPQALAFEHRLVAAVIDPGVVDVSTHWTSHLPPELMKLLEAGKRDAFNQIMAQVTADPVMARTLAFRARPYGISDLYDLFTAVRKYNLRDVASRIRTPLLITNPEDEQFWPGQSRELFDLLTGPKEMIDFGRTDGANVHCEPMARRLVEMAMLDWLQARLDAR